MPPPRTPRTFTVNPQIKEGPPLCLGLAGPPGSGKTVSALRIASGMSRVRGGKPVLIDTEAGRALKYRIDRDPNGFDFDYIDFRPPFEPAYFLDAIHEALKLNPSAVIVDNASDEHEGPGGVLEWHDRLVPNFSGNEWAAWGPPKASRKVLTNGIQQIRTPVIFTFRARPKTKTEKRQKNGRTVEVPVSLGYMAVAGEELVGVMDLLCLLPPKSNGVATWSSDKAGEDFTIKIPYYLARYIVKGEPLNEDLGEKLALWQAGQVDDRGAVSLSRHAEGGTKRQRTAEEMVDDYVARVNRIGKLVDGSDERTGEGLEELRTFQLDPGTVKFVTRMRDERPDLHDRIVEANSRRARELEPPSEVVVDDEDDRPEEEDAEFPQDPALARPGED